jgi:hypothetical protein
MNRTFWQLLEDSVIVQAILTLAVWAAVIYMAVTRQVIPDILSVGAATILGYYFGNKQTQAVRRALLGG